MATKQLESREREGIKILIERNKRRAANYSDEIRKIDHQIFVCDLMELLEESAKIEQTVN